MFGKLKEKLKGWIGKLKPTEEPKEEKKTKKDKKSEKKVKETKSSKETKSEKIITSPQLPQQDEVSTNLPKVEETQIQEITQEEKPQKTGFFDRFREKLTNEKFEELFAELQMILLQNNVAMSAVESIRESLAIRLIGKNLKDVNLAKELKESIEKLLINPPNFIEDIKSSLKEKTPFIILFSGINGSGKTTTIAKVAHLLQKNKLSVCLAAADTFRAASIEQIQQHANKLGIPLIKKDYGADPAAVGFDAVAYAKKNRIDVVLIDTAGRMQNKDSLMKEMEKIARVTKPDMKIFLGESITGNDATEQAKAFNDSINLTGIILSKADVDEKGGTAISVSQVTKKPILFLGTGQSYDDLEVFDKDKMIEKLGL